MCNLLLIYLALFIPGANAGWMRAILIFSIVSIYTGINLVGIREMTIVSNVFTVSKLFPCCFS